MSLVIYDRVRETTVVTGTSDAVLLGAVTGFQAFSVVGNGNTTYYTIADQAGVNWETGLGTYSTSGPTLERTTVLSSSNAGNKVSFPAGTKDVFLTYPSDKAVYLDGSDNVQPALGTVNATTVDTTNLEVTNLKALDGTTAGSIANSTGVVTLASSVLTTTDINGGTIDNTAIGGSTAAAGTFTSLSDSGNLTFTGTGNRITGDFSNSTPSNRIAFQASTTDSATRISVIPNGTSTNTSLDLFSNATDLSNSSLFRFVNVGTESQLSSTRTGTGTFLPITMYTGGSERLRIDTSGNVGIGATSPTYKLQIQSGASTILAGADSAATTLTDATQKVMRFGVPHYTNAEEPVGALFISSTVSANAMLIGGGTGQFNAATVLQFYTAANNTTVTGTERMRIDSAGNVGVGLTNAASKLTVGGNPPAAGALAAVGAAAGISLALSDNVNCSLYVRHPAAGPVIGTDGGNALRFATNGNAASDEKMRIDSSGNVGIGTSAPSAGIRLDVAAAESVIRCTSTTGTNASYQLFGNTGGSLYVGRDSSGGGITGAAYSNVLLGTGAYPMVFGTNGVERMRIDVDGFVCVGTSTALVSNSGRGNITLNGANDAVFAFGIGGTNSAYIYNSSGALEINAVGSRIISFVNNGSERMRITAGGEVYIAGTTDQGAFNLQCNGTGVWGAGAYTNGSDARIKEDIASLDSGLDIVAKLNPVTYRYKEDWSKDQNIQPGFIAQELLVALEGTNYVDGVVTQGGEYMSVAYQNLIPVLTKAIQEQQTLIENLTTRLNALEGN